MTEVERCSRVLCRARLEVREDRMLGRITLYCPQCERRKAGICAECPLPVDGPVGRTTRCATHRVEMDRRRWNRSRLRNIEATRLRDRMSRRVDPERPMSNSDAGKIGGPRGAAGRMKSTTPEWRKELSRKMIAAREAKRAEKRAAAARASA